MKQAYRALNGLNYPGKKGEQRAEAGDVLTDLPASAIEAYLAAGDIVAADAPEVVA